MGEYIKPGIYINEFDKSQYVTEGPTTITGVVGESKKGPANEVTLVTTYSEYTDLFGQDSGYLDFFARFFFKYGGNKLLVVRVTDEYRFAGLSTGCYSLYKVPEHELPLASSDVDIPIEFSAGLDIAEWPDSGLVRLEYNNSYEYIIYSEIEFVSFGNITLKNCRRGLNGSSAISIYAWSQEATPSSGTEFFTTPSAHGLRNGDRVQFTGIGGGVAVNTDYWVINRTSSTFQISTTASGTVPFNLTNATINYVKKQPEPTRIVRLLTPVVSATLLSGAGSLNIMVEVVKDGKFSANENIEFADGSMRRIASITTQNETLGTATLRLMSAAPTGSIVTGGRVTLIPDPFYGAIGDFTYTKYTEYDKWGAALLDSMGNVINPAGVTDPEEDELFMLTYARSCGAWANTEVLVSIYNNKTWSSTPRPYYLNKINYTPQSDDELLIIVESAITGAIEESWLVSLDPTAVDYWKKTIFITDVINTQSKFIRVFVNPDYVAQGTYTVLPSYAERFYLGGGTDGNGTPVREFKILAGYNLFANKNDVDVDLISAGGNQSLAVQANILAIAGARMDCVGILNIPLGLDTTDAIRYKGLLSASTYGSIYYNGTKVLDAFTGAKPFLPPAIQMTPLLVKTDLIRDPWWATAGYNRGMLNEVIELEHKVDDGDFSLLYVEGINPLVNDGEGPVCLGIKTMYTGSSAFNLLPIRRLMLKMEKDIKASMKGFMFEPNTFDTRLRIVRTVEPYLDSIKARDGIEDYKVICDSTNNTNQTMAQGQIIVDIYIKPIFAAQYLIFNFTVTKDEISSIING